METINMQNISNSAKEHSAKEPIGKYGVKRHTVGGVNGRLISAKVSPRPHSRSGNRRLTAA